MPDDPAGSPGTPRSFESRFTARSYELDAFGHVNHSVFLNWFEQARFDALEAGGHPAGQMVADGWAVVVVRVEVDYRAEVLLGDEVAIRTRVAEARGSSMTLAQRATRIRRPTSPRAAPEAPDRPHDGGDDDVHGGGHGDRHEGGDGDMHGGDDAREDDEKLVAEARIVAVWMKDGRPTRIPADVREALGAPPRPTAE